ncbi:MAG TPA: helix-turn-helix transcriptional regulator, partial [Thermomicrobiales bacterium]|nr:helix-turn-helix transcriptional regulator [Thermomicrobiales bacterium]
MAKDDGNGQSGADPREGPSLGELVRDRRRDLHLTQEGLAERMGGNVHQGDISQIERGVVAYPRRERLAALAAA